MVCMKTTDFDNKKLASWVLMVHGEIVKKDFDKKNWEIAEVTEAQSLDF